MSKYYKQRAGVLSLKCSQLWMLPELSTLMTLGRIRENHKCFFKGNIEHFHCRLISPISRILTSHSFFGERAGNFLFRVPHFNNHCICQNRPIREPTVSACSELLLTVLHIFCAAKFIQIPRLGRSQIQIACGTKYPTIGKLTCIALNTVSRPGAKSVTGFLTCRAEYNWVASCLCPRSPDRSRLSACVVDICRRQAVCSQKVQLAIRQKVWVHCYDLRRKFSLAFHQLSRAKRLLAIKTVSTDAFVRMKREGGWFWTLGRFWDRRGGNRTRDNEFRFFK